LKIQKVFLSYQVHKQTKNEQYPSKVEEVTNIDEQRNVPLSARIPVGLLAVVMSFT